MDVFWVVEVLMVTLGVVAVSFAAAVTAEAVSRRFRERVPGRAPTVANSSKSPTLTIGVVRRERDWHRVATRAWTICVAASVSRSRPSGC